MSPHILAGSVPVARLPPLLASSPPRQSRTTSLFTFSKGCRRCCGEVSFSLYLCLPFFLSIVPAPNSAPLSTGPYEGPSSSKQRPHLFCFVFCFVFCLCRAVSACFAFLLNLSMTGTVRHVHECTRHCFFSLCVRLTTRTRSCLFADTGARRWCEVTGASPCEFAESSQPTLPNNPRGDGGGQKETSLTD